MFTKEEQNARATFRKIYKYTNTWNPIVVMVISTKTMDGVAPIKNSTLPQVYNSLKPVFLHKFQFKNFRQIFTQKNHKATQPQYMFLTLIYLKALITFLHVFLLTHRFFYNWKINSFLNNLNRNLYKFTYSVLQYHLYNLSYLLLWFSFY